MSRQSLRVLPPAPKSCRGCGECCRGLSVDVLPDDNLVPREMISHDGSSLGHGVMKQRKDGTRVAFDRLTKRCTIYARRPFVCVEFRRGGTECRKVSKHLNVTRLSIATQRRIERELFS